MGTFKIFAGGMKQALRAVATPLEEATARHT
jgi:hypothetical protein